MSTFLSLLAEDLFTKYNGNFENLCIIFPNKRAGLFLAEEIAKRTQQPIWMPDILTLDEFITRNIGLRKIDDLALIIKLYKSYQTVSPMKESFDDFYHWGSMLLSDFDDIDKYLVHADDLFQNLVSYKDIEASFDYLDEEQIELIRQFWRCFKTERFSKEQQRFLSVWECLLPTYNLFRDSLQTEGLCYSGMGQRYYIEHIQEYTQASELIFAGFNALNICEKRIFDYYKEKGNVRFYWDYDLYYTNNVFHEAGFYMRENLKRYPNELPASYFDNLNHKQKKIEYIAVPSTIGQAKLLPSLMSNRSIEDSNQRTAIVLCDEEMLLPVINSFSPVKHKINVTMGYPARKSAIAGLISLLLDLQLYRKTEKGVLYFYYKPVTAILSHQLILRLYPEECKLLVNTINSKNLVYIDATELQVNSLFNTIFKDDDQAIIAYLLTILESQIHKFAEDNEKFALEKEILFTLYASIRGIDNTFRSNDIIPKNELYIQIIRKLMDELTIPFEGEPIEGIQLMGLMETRMLDFDQLILISANEGILPKGGVASSFIPYSLRSAFGMPTPEHQDALFAYYFYRLIQRSKHMKIMYSSQTKGMISGEMSRFLYQLKYESKLQIHETTLQNDIEIDEISPIIIVKNEQIQRQLTRYWSKESNTDLSPSALNCYLECPLRFYYKYIASITEPQNIAEQLDYRLLGTIFHESCEEIYGRFGRSQLQSEQLDSLLQNNHLIDQAIKNAYAKIYKDQIDQLLDSGLNALILNVIRKYIKQLLRFDKAFTPFSMISMEKKYRTTIRLDKINIRIGGSIDRVDEISGAVRILDYKTGSDTTKFKNIESLFDSEEEKRNKAAFQTMLYALMYCDTTNETRAVIPGVYNTKLLFSEGYDYRLNCDNTPIVDFNRYRDSYVEHLKELLRELFDPEIPFRQTSSRKRCEYCTYRTICLK